MIFHTFGAEVSCQVIFCHFGRLTRLQQRGLSQNVTKAGGPGLPLCRVLITFRVTWHVTNCHEVGGCGSPLYRVITRRAAWRLSRFVTCSHNTFELLEPVILCHDLGCNALLQVNICSVSPFGDSRAGYTERLFPGADTKRCQAQSCHLLSRS